MPRIPNQARQIKWQAMSKAMKLCTICRLPTKQYVTRKGKVKQYTTCEHHRLADKARYSKKKLVKRMTSLVVGLADGKVNNE